MKSMKKSILLGTMAVSVMLTSVVQAKGRVPALNMKNKTLAVGQKCQLKVKNADKKKVKWSSTKKKIATVSKKGKVTAKKTGTTKIRAKIGKKVLVCKIVVKKAKTKSPSTVQQPSAKVTENTTKDTPKLSAKPTEKTKVSPTSKPTSTPNSIVNNPTEDPNKRDEGWVPGWY